MAPPLTRTTRQGAPYCRPPDIEEAIDRAIAEDIDVLRKRAAVTDPASSEYMPTECLLHLVRAARVTKDTKRTNHLLPVLLARCEIRLLRAIPDGSRHDAAGLRDEVLQHFGLMIAKTGTDEDAFELDYFEIRFNAALTTLRLKYIEKDTTRRRVYRPIPEQTDEDGSAIDEGQVLSRLSEAARTPAQQEHYVYLQEALAFIATLPPHERDTVINVYLRGFNIEAGDSDEVTAATLAGVTPRAISKRLKSAAEKLKKFNEESNP